jgi:hypothetical protein
MDNLDFDQLASLLHAAFALGPQERALALFIDLPDERLADSEPWLDRRAMALDWFRILLARQADLPFSRIVLCAYPHVGGNNNDLPERVIVCRTPEEAAAIDGTEEALPAVLADTSVVLALTELSATAPLKLLAKEHGFRGATLPDFRRAMLPVLAIDIDDIHRRVMEFKDRLDRATSAVVVLAAAGREYRTVFDLRFRTAHASSGRMREPGTVGNLPSGEAYIVPYEGEREGEPSRTQGELPVQFGDEVVVYRIDANRAVAVLSNGAAADRERRLLADEPAYGNMAEVGIGVLGEWGIEAIGSVLLDEKLGLHIAFGRSDHFGGSTGPGAWRDRSRVVHIDRVYVSSVQPQVSVVAFTLEYPGGDTERIIASGRYTV